MNNVVLDASAVLAVANREKGADIVLKARPRGIVSAVNHMEVVSKLLRTKIDANEVTAFLAEAFPVVIPFDSEQADRAGRLHAACREKHISYADCACMALAAIRGLPVLTGDRDWLDLPLGLDIRCFR